jgi:hypothetical protein
MLIAMQYLYHGCLHIYLLCRNFCDLIYNMYWTLNITASSTEGAKCGTGTAYPLQFTSKWWCGPRWWSLQFKQWWTTIPAYQQNEDTITSQLKQLNTCVSYGPIIKLVSVTPPLWIEVPVRRQDIERSCIFMLGYQFWFFYIQFWKKSLKISKGANQNPYIEEGQTTQYPKEKVQKEKQRSTELTVPALWYLYRTWNDIYLHCIVLCTTLSEQFQNPIKKEPQSIPPTCIYLTAHFSSLVKFYFHFNTYFWSRVSPSIFLYEFYNKSWYLPPFLECARSISIIINLL